MRIYLDNAATTPLHPDVLEAMMPYLTNFYGNPSSQHSAGREVRSAIEESRKWIAQCIHAQPGDIVFTSGGTESNNMVLKGVVRDLGVKHIVISPIEHHCVLDTAEYLHHTGQVKLTVLSVNELGQINLQELEEVLSNSIDKTLVSIMHANNEIGSLLDLNAVVQLCKTYNALLHSDTVQTFAHYPINVQETPVDFISASAHKFHGPKGVGFLYMRKSAKINAYIHGGSQERNMRAGTENITGIIGMAKAAKLAYEHLDEDRKYILSLKEYLITKIKEVLPDIEFNGPVDENSLFTVVSLSLPPHPMGSLLLFQLDMQGICVSGGSACSSGANKGSHVISALHRPDNRIPLRCSFSKFNTQEEIDTLISVLKSLYEQK